MTEQIKREECHVGIYPCCIEFENGKVIRNCYACIEKYGYEKGRADERENLIQEIKKLREASIMTNDYTHGFVKGLDFVIDMMKGGAEDTKVADLNQKCGSCKWLNKEKKTSVGYVCENPNKKWRTCTAHLKPKTCKACKEYEKKDYVKEN